MEIINWKKARTSIQQIDPKLTKILDEWCPDYPLLKVNYRFGDVILKNGYLHFCLESGKNIPINADEISHTIREQFSYTNVPLGFITQGSTEVFLESDHRCVPLSYFEPGVILGLWESLEPENSYFPRRIWQVSAGARSIFMLPGISQRIQHEKLKKKYQVRNSPPSNLYQHRDIFKQLASHTKFKQKWNCEIIYFSKNWLRPDNKNQHWLRFHHYLLEEAWNLSSYNRNLVTLDVIWLRFSEFLAKEGIKISSNLFQILKQVIAIGVGAAPGFRPVGKSQLSAPVKELQRIYIESYGLNDYVPTIMSPSYFQPFEYNEPIYYSFQVPTQIELSYKIKNILGELRELKNILSIFLEMNLDGKLAIENTPIEWLIKNVKFSFYHPDVKAFDSIQNSKRMPSYDSNLMKMKRASKKGRRFAAASHFTTGCVALSMS